MISKPILILVLLLAVGLLATACAKATEAPKAAESAVLYLNDFYPGWTSSPPEEVEDQGLSEECKRHDAPGKVTKAESDQFTGPDDQVVSSAATVFLSKEASQAALNATVTVLDLSFPGLGESSRAWRTVIELQTTPRQTRVSDSVNIVIGRIGGTFVYSSTGTPDADEELELATLFAGKLKKAEETLAD